MKGTKSDNKNEYDEEVSRLRVRDAVLPIIFGMALGGVFGAYLSIPILPVAVFDVLLIFLFWRALSGGFRMTTLAVVFLLAISAGVMRGQMVALSHIPFIDGRSVRLSGVIVKEPSGSDYVVDAGVPGGLILLRAPEYPTYKYGDKISFITTLTLPEDFRTDTGVMFRYRAMLRARGVVYSAKTQEVKILSFQKGNYFVASLLAFKNKLRELSNSLTEPEGALLRGMLLGGKSELPKSVEADFITSSLIHIVVLSGANLMLIASIAIKMFRRWFGFRAGLLAAAFVTVLYALMGGMEGATLRALVMVLLLILAHYLHRDGNAGRLLFVAVAGMTIVNPYLPLDDPSFQLSVAALFGLLFLAPVLEMRLLKSRSSSSVVDYTAAIFGTQFMVMPLIAFMSGQVSPWGFLANFLVLYALEFVPLFAITLFSPFSLIKIPLFLILAYVIKVAHLVASLPFSTIPIRVGVWSLGVSYSIFFVWLWSRWRNSNMSPLSRFTERENKKDLERGRIPWERDHIGSLTREKEMVVDWD